MGSLALVARFYRQVEQGKALIVNTMNKEPVVAFTGAMVYPIINRAEVMDLSVKTIDIDRRGKEGLICNDNIRADINVTFFVRVNKTRDDVLKVAQSIGCARASDPKALEELFTAKFAEALKTVGKHFNFEQLYTKRDDFKDKIIEVIGKDLNGFVLDDAAIDYLEQTPLEALDKDNIMDADGIRKITEITVQHNVQTNELRQKERMEMGSQNLNADEAIFRFEQRRAEAEAKKAKEIAVAQSREQNEAARIASDEQKKTLLVHHKNEEETLVAERGEAARRGRRAEEPRARDRRRDRARREGAPARGDRARARGRRSSASRATRRSSSRRRRSRTSSARASPSTRPSPSKKRTSRTCAPSRGANREREALKIKADAEASDHDGQAGEGGRGQRRGREARGSAEDDHRRRRARHRRQARAREDPARRRRAGRGRGRGPREGSREGGGRRRDREARSGRGARLAREDAVASAAGEEKQGLAKARVKKRATPTAPCSHGARRSPRRANVREKLLAEAAGIAEKAVSMKALDEASREHEEFRLKLDKEKIIELETIHAKRDMAAARRRSWRRRSPTRSSTSSAATVRSSIAS